MILQQGILTHAINEKQTYSNGAPPQYQPFKSRPGERIG